MKGTVFWTRRNLSILLASVVVSIIAVSSSNKTDRWATAWGPAVFLMLSFDTLWCALARTRGGLNRIRIIEKLMERPYNAYQLSEKLGVDYRTTRHHLDVLLKSEILARPEGDSYGTMYFLSDEFRNNIDAYEKVKTCVLEDLDEDLPE